MSDPPVHEGQILTGSLFNEPMRVETVQANGPVSWVVGLVGTQSERFRKVTLTADELKQLTIIDGRHSFDGDGRLLRLGLQAYALGIPYEFDAYFGLSTSRVDPLPHQVEQEAAVGTNPLQGELLPDMRPSAAPTIRGRGRIRGTRSNVAVSDEGLAAAREATTLDRVHAGMLLQDGGRTNALRALLNAEQERGPDFLRLANTFSALYPKGSEEKRLIDAMLPAVPR